MAIIYPNSVPSSERNLSEQELLADPNICTDVTREQVASFLQWASKMIRQKRCMFEYDGRDTTSHKKSKDFSRTYGLWDKRERELLVTNVTVEEFCHILKSPDGFPLYVFCLERELMKALYGYCTVQIYLKERKRDKHGNNLLVVSLHELEKPIVCIFAE